jgi:hypothetical protein
VEGWCRRGEKVNLQSNGAGGLYLESALQLLCA